MAMQNPTASGLIRPAPGDHDHDSFFIDGRWQRAEQPRVTAVYDSATEARLGIIASATTAEIDAAVSAARAALPAWASLTPVERGRHIETLHAALTLRTGELAGLISAQVGTAARVCPAIQVKSALDVLAHFAKLLDSYAFEEEIANSQVVMEPVGTVAAITPWNYPLFQTMAKVGAALAAGCTVVHKPSGLAPLSSFLIAEAAESVGFPRGVFNLITGPGDTVGEALVSHHGIDMVSFTGSTVAGTRVYELAAATIKRVALELGGKSASVLLDDADLAIAVRTSVNRAFLNSGQTCDAWTRLVAPVDRLDEVVELAVAATRRLTVGDPFDESTRLGPLVSGEQVERVRRYVIGALRDGASAALGGPEPPEGLQRGHYFRPTILTGVDPRMTVAREEVFGPVLAILTYSSEAEALDIANGTDYGLSGAVWSGDVGRATAFARRMIAGQVVVNGGPFNAMAPVGGVKRSGIGRELGRHGLEEFLETKSFVLPGSPDSGA